MKKKRFIKEREEKVGARSPSDTLRVWDRYSSGARYWRSFTFIEFYIISFCCLMMVLLYTTSSPTIRRPAVPHAGRYSAKSFSDLRYISFATELVNLLSNYNPSSVVPQYDKVKQFLWEPALTDFQKAALLEIQTIQRIARSEIFIIEPTQTLVSRDHKNGLIRVTLNGIRYASLGSRKLKPVRVRYELTMIQIPINVLNQYGIVVVEFGMKIIENEGKVALNSNFNSYQLRQSDANIGLV